MNVFNLFIIILLYSLSFALGALEIEFLELDKAKVIGVKTLQNYVNNFEENGNMAIQLILENNSYNLKPLPCHAKRGQFSWTPPDSIPENTYGHFYYEIEIGEEKITGKTATMKFVSAPTSSTPSNSSSSNSSSTNSSSSTSSSSKTSSSKYSSDRTTNKSTPTSYDVSHNENNNNTENEGFINTVDTQITYVDIPDQNEEPEPETEPEPEPEPEPESSPDESNKNGKLYIIIGSGCSGLFVIALAGVFIFNRFKSKRISEYDVEDEKPFNVSKSNNIDYSKMAMKYPDMPSLLDGNLSPVSINNSPSIGSPMSNSNNGYFNNINNIKSYRVPNIETASSVPSSFTNSPNINNNNYNSNKRNIINLNSNPNTDLNIDVKPLMISKSDFFVTPRFGSLTRRKGPNDMNTSLMNDEENYKGDYSMLSIMSANNNSYYDQFQAEHTVDHFLLNKVCTVAYVIEPENDDELSLNIGDKVKILEVYDDGWAYSIHLNTGKEGMIPLNCTSEFYQ